MTLVAAAVAADLVCLTDCERDWLAAVAVVPHLAASQPAVAKAFMEALAEAIVSQVVVVSPTTTEKNRDSKFEKA